MMRHITLFKSFPITVIRKAAGAQVNSVRSGGQVNGKLLASLIVAQTGFGWLSTMLKDVSKGKEPYTIPDAFAESNPDVLKAQITRAISQGGGFGLYGDLLFGNYNRYSNQFIPFAMGPTAGMAEDIMGIYSQAKQGEGTKALNQALRTISGVTPGANIFWSRWALDYYVIHYLNEMTNPGYLRRREQSIMEHYNQRYFIPPSRNASFLGIDEQ